MECGKVTEGRVIKVPWILRKIHVVLENSRMIKLSDREDHEVMDEPLLPNSLLGGKTSFLK